MHYLLFYQVGPDYVERRAPYRAQHLALARAAVERGELVLAGAVGDPPEMSLLLFKGDSAATAEAFARADPYVANGVVTNWRVQPWSTVVGKDAAIAVT
jgi:uncharacterized protein YciI